MRDQIDLTAVEPEDVRLAQALAALVDRLSTGVVLVDADLRVVSANGQAMAVIAQASILGTADGRLHLDKDLEVRLRRAILFVLAEPSRIEHLVLQAADETEVLLVTCHAARPYDGMAALWIGLQAQGPACDHLVQLHDLTRAEHEVLKRLASGMSPEVMSGLLGVSIATVRTHLQRLYAKTGAASQAQLVRLAHMLPWAARTPG